MGDTGKAVEGRENGVPAGEREALAELLHGQYCHCGDHVQHRGEAHIQFDGGEAVFDRMADAVLAAGYRRVVADDETVERVAAVLWRCIHPTGARWEEMAGSRSQDRFRAHAEAVVAALRGGD